MKPTQTFLFFLAVGLLLLLTSVVKQNFENNVLLATLQFPSPKDIFAIPEDNNQKLIRSIAKLDSTFNEKEIEKIDTAAIRKRLDSLLTLQKKIQFPGGDKSSLYVFFSKAKTERVRVMHYGDSQIEGERITAQIRDKMQRLWGGGGPGLFPVIPVAPKLSVIVETTGEWYRNVGFGPRDTTIKHNLYGPLMSYAIYNDKDTSEHKIIISPNAKAYVTAKNFDKFLIYYGLMEGKCSYTISQENQILKSGILEPVKWAYIEVSVSNQAPVNVTFKGNSPMIYALSLEKSGKGVIVDNIPMRGASGTDFTKQNKSFFRSTLQTFQPGLLILQFGGNVLPYLDDEKECKNYGRWISSQLKYLKSLLPETAILFIGPSDMSTKINGEYQTYPLLECVRDELKKAALENGCMFWDMYLNMGGYNSMIKWVEADPPLAGKDYTHFTLSGTKKISEMLWQAIENEYKEFQMTNKNSYQKLNKE